MVAANPGVADFARKVHFLSSAQGACRQLSDDICERTREEADNDEGWNYAARYDYFRQYLLSPSYTFGDSEW